MVEIGGTLAQWDGMSCLFSFPAQSLGNREENSKEQTKNKGKQTAFSPAPGGEAKGTPCLGCYGMYVGSKSDQPNSSEKKPKLLKYKTPPSSDESLRLKMLKVKRMMLEKHHQLLVLLLQFFFSVACWPPSMADYHVREAFGTTRYNQSCIIWTTTAIACACS